MKEGKCRSIRNNLIWNVLKRSVVGRIDNEMLWHRTVWSIPPYYSSIHSSSTNCYFYGPDTQTAIILYTWNYFILLCPFLTSPSLECRCYDMRSEWHWNGIDIVLWSTRLISLQDNWTQYNISITCEESSQVMYGKEREENEIEGNCREGRRMMW